MSDQGSDPPAELSVADVLLLEKACDRFESACRQQSSPAIEDYLGNAPEPLKSELLKQLILVEWEYHQASGQRPQFSDYYARFSDEENAVHEACNAWLAAHPGAPRSDQVESTLGMQLSDSIIEHDGISSECLNLNPTDRYEIHSQVGCGGSAIVYRGHDRLLGRRLALKTLRPDQAIYHDLADRFLAEAKIASQLQHPGIAAVYDQGQLGDGRPFLAMKLVEGRTFAEILGQRKEPNEDQGRLLGIFEQVCQTLGYAHSRGIVHRDLKPANIMVGEFGEVQVMDWGLAKVMPGDVLAKAEVTDRDMDDLPAGADSVRINLENHQHSQDGLIMGTLGYMAPEQARGELSAIDARSDVFSLGAILYEILTGEPPLVGGSMTRRLRKSREDNLDQMREQLAVCGAEKEIIDVALRCLSFDPAQRPENGSAVASEVCDFLGSLQEQLVEQRLQREKEKVRIETEARRRKLRIFLTVSLAGLFLVSALTLIYWQGQNVRYRREMEQASHDLYRAERNIIEGDLRAANAALKEAGARLDEQSTPELIATHQALVAQVDFAEQLNLVDQRRTTPNNFGWFDNDRALREYRGAFESVGIKMFEDDPEEIAKSIRDSLVLGEILAAIDNWALVCVYRMKFDPDRRDEYMRQRDRLLTVARLVDPHPQLRDQLRDPGFWDDPDELEALAKTIDATDLSPRLAALLGELLRFSGRDYESLLREFQAAYPDDFWLNFNLARAVRTNNIDDALRFYQAALAVEPQSFSILGNLALVFLIKNDYEQAKTYFMYSLDINPNYLPTLKNLAACYRELGEMRDAAHTLQRVVELSPDDAMALLLLADTLDEIGDLGAARVAYEKTVERFPEFQPPGAMFQNGRKVTKQQLIAFAHYKIGRMCSDQHRLEEAISQLQSSVQISATADSHLELGLVLLREGRFEESAEHFSAAHEMGTEESNWSWPTEAWVTQTRRWEILANQLDAYLDGSVDPANPDESIDLARLCHILGEHRAAIDFYQSTVNLPFENSPRDQHGFWAACSALIVAQEESLDGSIESDAGASLRELAREWLEKELNGLRQAREREEMAPEIIRRLINPWLRSPVLAAVRDERGLDELSSAERVAWESLWHDVHGLRHATLVNDPESTESDSGN